MTRTLIAVLALAGMTGMAAATTVVIVEPLGQAQIVEAKKCKAGFMLNKRKTRCIAKSSGSGSSSGGSSSSGGGSSSGGSF